MFRKILYITLAFIGLGIFSGCVIDGSDTGANAPIETQTVSEIDRDSNMEKARGLIFNMPKIDDQLNVSANDSEDWRYIIVPQPGSLSISLKLDTPDRIKGSCRIVDAMGRELHKVPFEPNENFYEINDYRVAEGLYYFQMIATEGASVYTVGAKFTASEPEPVVVAQITEPEEPDPAPSPRKKKDKDKDKKKEKDKDTSKPAPPPPPPAAESKKVVGFISLITPKADGSAEVTIRNAGKDKGVEVGASGTIEGTSMKLKTTQCFATSCRALIPDSADPKAIKKGANVIFKISQ